MEKMRMESVDMTAQNVDKIGALFPNCVTETIGEDGKPKKAINFDLLKQMLSGDVIEGSEAYEFTWVGKKAAIVEANRPIRKTLRPCKEESVDWDTTENLYIEGDNLEVLKLLQESYLGAIKMIYIDPPYNTGSDFIYRDDFKQSTAEYEDDLGLYGTDGNRMFKNSDANGRFHSDWCSMIYSRLMLARNLLAEDGVIFISIGEEEVHNLIKICDTVFGESNCISKITRVVKNASNMGSFFAPSTDFVLCYAKNISKTSPFKGEVDTSLYKKIETSGERAGEYYRDDVAFFQSGLKHGGSRYPIVCPDGELVNTPDNKPWRASEQTFLSWVEKGLIVFKKTTTSPLIIEGTNQRAHWNLYTKSYLSDRQETGTQPRNLLLDFINRKGADLLKQYDIPFDFAKPVELMHFLCKIINDRDAIVLDFFSGSATTAHSVMKLNAEDGGNRKFIMIQLPEKCEEGSAAQKSGFKTICDIGKERIRRAGKKIKEDSPLTTQYLDTGFRVFKLDDTNMNDVYYAAGDYSQDMLDMLESNVKADRTDLDLLFGSLLEWGLPLSLPYSSEVIEGCSVHTYNDGDLIACFDENIPDSVIKFIARKQPLRVVFRDSSFANSPSKINVSEVFKLLAPDTRVKVI